MSANPIHDGARPSTVLERTKGKFMAESNGLRPYAFALTVPDLRRTVGYFVLGFGRDWGDGALAGAFAWRRPDDDRPLSRRDASGANRRPKRFRESPRR